MRPRRVPLRRSLLLRLLATSVLVAVCAIVATAWLAVKTTTTAIRQEQGRSLANDTNVYRELVGYAATHKNWSAVRGTIDELAKDTGRRVTLLTQDGRPIVDSVATGPSLRGARPSATVDALNLDQALTGGTTEIDPRAVGPYRLTARERDDLRGVADFEVTCLKADGIDATVTEDPSGRPVVTLPTGVRQFVGPGSPGCREVAGEVTKTEQSAMDKLQRLVATCLGITEPDPLVFVTPDFSVTTADDRGGKLQNDPRAVACVQSQRKAQLKPYVAPPALLFVTDPTGATAQPRFNLSRTNALRIVGVTGSVLVLAILITILVGARLVRPLRALTEAARQPVDLHARAPVTTHDEIGYLATALNDLSERREQTERHRKAMVSDVAHELRTPLTNIRSWLEAAQDGLAPVDPQLLTLLLEEAVLLQHIIDDLRDLAAADAGSLRIHPELVYVNDALEQVADAHRGAAETAGVRLRVEADGDPEVVVDPVRLRQLVGNLVSNAVRHTPAGGSVAVRSRVADGQLIVDVVDTGVGISPADLPKVFARFWRADGSRTRATGGSGLGLAIARKLAEAHRGDLTVASRQGEGTVFTIRLPAVSPAPSPAAGGRHGSPVQR
jgi:two-component system sensor histidine kinase BaeS